MNSEPEIQVLSRSDDDNLNEVLGVATLAGQILLENGAEIFRVEETMRRISAHFGVKEEDFFIVSNGIFSSGADRKHGRIFARIQYIPIKSTQLSRVAAVNQLSREIENGKYTLQETLEKLEQIRKSPELPFWLQILAASIGSGAFCAMFGGSWKDCLVAALAGLLLYIFVLKVSGPHFSKITKNLTGGALITLVCVICQQLGFVDGLNFTIIGSVMPLVPGVAFINGIRDMAGGDYLAGVVRLLDALLAFVCIAVGVGIVFILYNRIFGGVIL